MDAPARPKRQLLLAVRAGRLGEVITLLDLIELTDEDRFNFLYYSIFYNQFRVAKHLIENGFERFLNNHSRSKQMFAVAGQNSIQYGNVDIVELLLQNGVDFYNFSADALLEAAAKEGNLKFIRSLALKVKGRDQARLLKKIMTNPVSGDLQYEIFQILLNYGSEALTIEEFCTTLYFAFSRDNKLAVKSLFTKACDFDAEELLKCTITKTRGWLPKLLRVLLEYGSSDSLPICDPKIFSNLFEALNKSNPLLNYHKSCAILLVNHITKLRVAKLFDSDETFQATVYRNETVMADYQNQCEAELARMIEQRIGISHITFYGILTKNIAQLARIARNKSIAETIKSGSYTAEFPIYSGLIHNQFEKGEIRKDLVEKGIKIYQSLISHFSNLPYDVMERVVCYSSNRDLRNLILATEANCSFPDEPAVSVDVLWDQ